MLLLRDRFCSFEVAFAAIALVSMVIFSLSMEATSGEGICAIDLRDRGRFCCATAVSPCNGGIVFVILLYVVISTVTYR